LSPTKKSKPATSRKYFERALRDESVNYTQNCICLHKIKNGFNTLLKPL
jgi:hypothetical protein